jgi:fused signal recognition particle receptor
MKERNLEGLLQLAAMSIEHQTEYWIIFGLWLAIALPIGILMVRKFIRVVREEERLDEKERAEKEAKGAPRTEETPTEKPSKKEPAAAAPTPVSLGEAFRKGLSKTHARIQGGLNRFFQNKNLSDDDIEELEELLYSADLGTATIERLLEKLRSLKDAELDQSTGLENGANPVKAALQKEIEEIFKELERKDSKHAKPADLNQLEYQPHVILVVGVNGSGKTTTIGKLTSKFSKEGKSVLVGAGDTFRAAAVEQLQVWADRSGAEIVKQGEGADPASVAFDAVSAAKARGKDVCIIDTAGRLHTKSNLMDELKKVKRVIQKVIPEAPHETLLVIDGVTGQNAIQQAKLFNEAIEIQGLVVTKLDGSAKGGAVVSVAHQLGLPVHYIGVGEQVDDLRVFNPEVFAKALIL